MTDTHAVRLKEEIGDEIDRLAQKHNTTKSDVLRELVENGLRAHKYYEEFEIQP